jgi:catechol 2,3-dioxygenase-like lactoylglutathione lyase family enzyme
MLAKSEAFSGFAVKDVDRAREFYGETLGLDLETFDEENGLLAIHHAGDRDTLVYAKEDHEPANYTILNFRVEDVGAAVEALSERGVEFERYEGFDQDERGVAHGPGPEIAWFKDPFGNILSVIEEE